MSKKGLVLAVAIAMLMTLLAACAGKGEEQGASNSANPSPSADTSAPPASEAAAPDYGDTGGLTLPLVDKPTTITWMVVSENPVADKFIVKEIEKRTGIHVDFQSYSKATFQEKLRVTLGSGKLPDIFHGLPLAEVKKLGKQKAVAAITDYADQLPNFTKLYLEENSWVKQSYGDEQSTMYTWPIYNMNRDVNHGFLYRKDIFDQHHIPLWTNTEEFYQALKALKEHYPQSYPLASKTTANLFKDYAYGWGIGGESYPMYYDEAAAEWKFAPIQPANKEMIDFLKKLLNEGLLDPEFLTDTSDSWTSKMTTDKAFVTFDWIGRLDLFYNQISSKNPSYDLRYGNPVGPTGNIRTLSPINNELNIAVANNANTEIALKLLDYMSSPSGGTLMSMGVEGEVFTLEHDKAVYPELTDVPLVDINVLANEYGLWLEGATLRPDRRSVYYNFTEKEQEAQDTMLAAQSFEPLDPVLNFTDAETAEIVELQTMLQKAAEEFNANYVLDPAYGDADWEEWKEYAEKLGASKLAAVYNEAQKRYGAASK
ncbi:extracellular solute-binding protein [Paenibacillus agaridevorans]|uniref:extracellular solute-binding protein n=1 Tax=Paenibacillus agaridevorans TaxID=171404 RepID=UPI001BE4B5DF|nr:extracellular solute-binding protein [Paenibacillus agaridevorans]